MARIYIKSSKEVAIIPEEKAIKIAELKSKFENKEMEDAWIDTELWKGFLSQIKSIELDPERKYDMPVYEKSDEASLKAMRKTREQLKKIGIIRN